MQPQDMQIDIEPTPNPDVLKFLPHRSVSGGRIVDYPSADDHDDESPLVSRLFALEGIQGVMLGADFISVTRQSGVAWSGLKSQLQGAIMAHYRSGEPVLRASAARAGGESRSESRPEEDEVSQKIRELLELRVRPAVAMDGGDIQFHGFDKGIVYVTLRGACAGCPSATVTLKMGIENMLRHYIPEVTEVRTVA